MRSASEQQGENERQCQKVEHEDRQEHTTFLPKRGFKLGSFMWLLLCNNKGREMYKKMCCTIRPFSLPLPLRITLLYFIF